METPTLELNDLTNSLIAAMDARYPGLSGEAPPAQTATPDVADPMDVLARWSAERQDAPTIIMRQSDGRWSPAGNDEVALALREAEMAQSITAQIEKPLNSAIAGFDLGSIAIGGSAGLLIGEAIDGFLARPEDRGLNVGAKVAAAFVVQQFGTKVVSRNATKYTIAVLAIQAMGDTLPINRWIGQFLHKVAPGTFAVPANQPMHQIPAGAPAMQAYPVAGRGATVDVIGDKF